MDGTIILTGATGGLGQELAKQLLQRPESYTLIFPVRDQKTTQAVHLQRLINSHGKANHIVSVPELNLARFDDIRAFISNINDKVSAGVIPPIRALILNAAVCYELNGLRFTHQMIETEKQPPPFEMNFAVNFLANVLLSLLLLQSVDKQHGRIVYTSSCTHDPNRPENEYYKPEKLKWDIADLAHPDMGNLDKDIAMEAMRRYGASKLALATFMHALRKRLDKTPGLESISIAGVDPGAVLHANIVKRASWKNRNFAFPLMQLYTRWVAQYLWPNGLFRTAEKSAQDLLSAALGSKDSWAHPAEAYFDGREQVEAAVEAKDERKQEELWGLSLQYVGLDASQTSLSTRA
ncbi:hypothetical protein MGYG_06419 [Nannizzia gypsea CBS 118893]|uniref:3beta-hydroxysteroid 3-dehydrogenase n=1 Tax=Arthroderma gypseum (strain ATCC MYA-4604 / CBS 118893) TaxID=535722 RepID=E4UZ92_ARTGP|nr:hypothetical protein MGYG_06419 [Nannizzia gypsea CBS 118893]EFR03422.1 hypothetical protein MGYG_06419 [Nannizzia gypsea CBS 118893]